jgi:hypothetical protein
MKQSSTDKFAYFVPSSKVQIKYGSTCFTISLHLQENCSFSATLYHLKTLHRWCLFLFYYVMPLWPSMNNLMNQSPSYGAYSASPQNGIARPQVMFHEPLVL